jgi:hypothetical protein
MYFLFVLTDGLDMHKDLTEEQLQAVGGGQFVAGLEYTISKNIQEVKGTLDYVSATKCNSGFAHPMFEVVEAKNQEPTKRLYHCMRLALFCYLKNR